MAGIDLDGNGSIDMYPDLARSSISAAGQADAKLQANATTNLQQINAIDTQLGQGPLGRSVAPAYNAVMNAVTTRLQEIATFAKAMVDAGLKAVDDYEAGDAEAAAAFSLPEPLPPAAAPPPPAFDPIAATATPPPGPVGGR